MKNFMSGNNAYDDSLLKSHENLLYLRSVAVLYVASSACVLIPVSCGIIFLQYTEEKYFISV